MGGHCTLKANVHEILSSYQVEAPSQPSSRFQPEMELPHFRAILLCLIVAQAAWILVEAKGGRGGGGGRGSSGGSRSSSSWSSSRSSSSYSTPSRSSSSSSWSSRTSSSGSSRPSSGTSSSGYYGWRRPSSVSSSNYGWTSPSATTVQATTSRHKGSSASAGFVAPATTATSTGSSPIPSAPPLPSSGSFTSPGSRVGNTPTPPYTGSNTGYTPPYTGGNTGYTPPYTGGNTGYTPPYTGGNTGYTPPYTGNTGYTPPYSGGTGYNPPYAGGAGYNPPYAGGAGYNPMYPQLGGGYNKGHSTSTRLQDAGLGFIAGHALSRGSGTRFHTRTHYYGSNWNRESGERTGHRRVVTLAASEAGTCSALRTNESRTFGINGPVTNENRTVGINDTVTVTLYRHTDYQGGHIEVHLTPNECFNLYLEQPRWNDQVSSIKPGNDSCVMIWEHKDCTGRFACVKQGTRGASGLADLNMNDELTSLQLC